MGWIGAARRFILQWRPTRHRRARQQQGYISTPTTRRRFIRLQTTTPAFRWITRQINCPTSRLTSSQCPPTRRLREKSSLSPSFPTLQRRRRRRPSPRTLSRFHSLTTILFPSSNILSPSRPTPPSLRPIRRRRCDDDPTLPPPPSLRLSLPLLLLREPYTPPGKLRSFLLALHLSLLLSRSPFSTLPLAPISQAYARPLPSTLPPCTI